MTVPAHTNTTTAAEVLAETLWDMRRHIGLVVADWPTCVETAERHPGSLIARRVAEHRELVVAVHERLAQAGLLADAPAAEPGGTCDASSATHGVPCLLERGHGALHRWRHITWDDHHTALAADEGERTGR